MMMFTWLIVAYATLLVVDIEVSRMYTEHLVYPVCSSSRVGHKCWCGWHSRALASPPPVTMVDRLAHVIAHFEC